MITRPRFPSSDPLREAPHASSPTKHVKIADFQVKKTTLENLESYKMLQVKVALSLSIISKLCSFTPRLSCTKAEGQQSQPDIQMLSLSFEISDQE